MPSASFNFNNLMVNIAKTLNVRHMHQFYSKYSFEFTQFNNKSTHSNISLVILKLKKNTNTQRKSRCLVKQWYFQFWNPFGMTLCVCVCVCFSSGLVCVAWATQIISAIRHYEPKMYQQKYDCVTSMKRCDQLSFGISLLEFRRKFCFRIHFNFILNWTDLTIWLNDCLVLLVENISIESVEQFLVGITVHTCSEMISSTVFSSFFFVCLKIFVFAKLKFISFWHFIGKFHVKYVRSVSLELHQIRLYIWYGCERKISIFVVTVVLNEAARSKICIYFYSL